MTRAKGKKKTFCLGLTGCIGMGKSTTASFFAEKGVPVFCADEEVHTLFKKREVLARIKKLFPEAFEKNRTLSRPKLAAIVFEKKEALEALEKVLHPFIVRAGKEFKAKAQKKGKKIILLDVPLLFEIGMDALCHATLCVSAPRATQERRVLKRKGMTVARLRAISRRHYTDAQKRKRADFIIKTDASKRAVQKQVEALLKTLEKDGT